MKKGQICTIRIEDMGPEGQGIGRVEGLVVFVTGAIIGDEVSVELTKVKKNYALGRLLEVLKYSDCRDKTYKCEFMEAGCGGCTLGGIDYKTQTAIKERQVREKLTRLGGLDKPLIEPIVVMEEDDNEGFGFYRYRNKAQFPVSTGGIITRKGGIVENLGQPAVGFYGGKSHVVVDCGDCLLQSFAAMAAANGLRRFMEEDNITAWDPKWEKGLIRHLIVKTAFDTKEVMVILVVNGKGIPNMSKLIEILDDVIYEAGYSLESVILNVNKKPKLTKDSIMGDENIVIAGKPTIVDKIGELQFEISPSSFYQVNPLQAKRLYDKVREYCLKDVEGGTDRNPDTVGTILDLYCGVGTIGLYCADIATEIIGIESVKEAVLDANRNAVINGVVNARYVCGRAEEELPKVAGHEADKSGIGIDGADIAILDPPRAGCRSELLEAVAKIGVKKIIYVSCDPATLGRDVKLLGELGYSFVEGTPVDMFPWTSHVETVVLMSKVR